VLNKFLKENFSDRNDDENETDDLKVENIPDNTDDCPTDDGVDQICQELYIESALDTAPSVHFQKIGIPNCRICLQPSTGDFKLITETNVSSMEYSQILMYTTGYIVTTDMDYYPASICETCETELLRSFEFKLRCEQTEEFLEHLYSCTSQEEADQLYEANFVHSQPAEMLVTNIKHSNEYEATQAEYDHIECDADLVKTEETIVVEEEIYEDLVSTGMVDTDNGINEVVVQDGNVDIDDIIDYDESMDVEQTIDVYNDNNVEVGEDIVDDDLDQQIAEQMEFVASEATTLKSFQPPEYYLRMACHICGRSVLSKCKYNYFFGKTYK
jgi:hypothetical protein